MSQLVRPRVKSASFKDRYFRSQSTRRGPSVELLFYTCEFAWYYDKSHWCRGFSQRSPFQQCVDVSLNIESRGWKRNNYASLIRYSFYFFPDLFIFPFAFFYLFIIHLRFLRIFLIRLFTIASSCYPDFVEQLQLQWLCMR